jgi:alkylhydroperoxidase family enzyme
MLLDAWSEYSKFTEEERAALAWIEELTLIADSGASTEAFEGLKEHFSGDEIGWLTLVAVSINAWNRIAISSRVQYDRKMFEQDHAEAAKTPEPA